MHVYHDPRSSGFCFVSWNLQIFDEPVWITVETKKKQYITLFFYSEIFSIELKMVSYSLTSLNHFGNWWSRYTIFFLDWFRYLTRHTNIVLTLFLAGTIVSCTGNLPLYIEPLSVTTKLRRRHVASMLSCQRLHWLTRLRST